MYLSTNGNIVDLKKSSRYDTEYFDVVTFSDCGDDVYCCVVECLENGRNIHYYLDVNSEHVVREPVIGWYRN